MPRSRAIPFVLLCACALLEALHGAPRVAAASAQATPLFTISGDVRTPLTITDDDLAWLPNTAITRVCPPNGPEAFQGLDLRGLVNAAGPLAADPAGYTVTITGATGASVTYPGDALAPLASAQHPGGPLLATSALPNPLPDGAGPVFLASQTCEATQDVAQVQTITVTTTADASPSAPASPSVDDPAGLAAAALRSDDLPGFSLRYSLAQAVLAPLPDNPTVQYGGYWAQDDTHLAELIDSYATADAASQPLRSLPTTVMAAATDAECDAASVRMLGPLGLGDEDGAYGYSCPGDGDTPATVIAGDAIRSGRVVITVAVSMPAPGDPTAQLQAAAQAAVADLTTTRQ